MDINKTPLLTEDQRQIALLIRKIIRSGDLRAAAWQWLKNSNPEAQDMPLDEFIDIMKTQLRAYQRGIEKSGGSRCSNCGSLQNKSIVAINDGWAAAWGAKSDKPPPR
jgi:hypothetical protein